MLTSKKWWKKRTRVKNHLCQVCCEQKKRTHVPSGWNVGGTIQRTLSFVTRNQQMMTMMMTMDHHCYYCWCYYCYFVFFVVVVVIVVVVEKIVKMRRMVKRKCYSHSWWWCCFWFFLLSTMSGSLSFSSTGQFLVSCCLLCFRLIVTDDTRRLSSIASLGFAQNCEVRLRSVKSRCRAAHCMNVVPASFQTPWAPWWILWHGTSDLSSARDIGWRVKVFVAPLSRRWWDLFPPLGDSRTVPSDKSFSCPNLSHLH